jgi:hypothetical protein
VASGAMDTGSLGPATRVLTFCGVASGKEGGVGVPPKRATQMPKAHNAITVIRTGLLDHTRCRFVAGPSVESNGCAIADRPSEVGPAE